MEADSSLYIYIYKERKRVTRVHQRLVRSLFLQSVRSSMDENLLWKKSMKGQFSLLYGWWYETWYGVKWNIDRYRDATMMGKMDGEDRCCEMLRRFRAYFFFFKLNYKNRGGKNGSILDLSSSFSKFNPIFR